jgi:hypothetical protein
MKTRMKNPGPTDLMHHPSHKILQQDPQSLGEVEFNTQSLTDL